MLIFRSKVLWSVFGAKGLTPGTFGRPHNGESPPVTTQFLTVRPGTR